MYAKSDFVFDYKVWLTLRNEKQTASTQWISGFRHDLSSHFDVLRRPVGFIAWLSSERDAHEWIP